MKKIIFLPLLFLFLTPLFAQPAAIPWWLSFEQGKQQFRAGNYDSALMLFEDSRRDRRAMYEQMERDFILLLSQREVRRVGDSLEKVEKVARDNLYKAAIAALDELYYRFPKTYFDNSAKSALAAFNKLKDYPEAEYWIGEIYRIEGELTLALAQYKKVYSILGERPLLASEEPDFGITIQYKIAAIYDTRQEYTDMIKVYESIIDNSDSLWINSSKAVSVRTNSNTQNASLPYEQAYASFERSAMTKTLSEQGINRFLELYRYNNKTSEKAHRYLGYYYAVRGRPSAEPHLMFSFLIQNSIIMEEIKRRQYDFAFTTEKDARGENQIHTLAELAAIANRNPMLVSYMDEVEYYKTAYYLSTSLYRNGKPSVARSIWEFLAVVPQAGEWQSRAITQLRSPHFEPIIEMPK
jgi:tetratricopeptide (TPR) repeat protein